MTNPPDDTLAHLSLDEQFFLHIARKHQLITERDLADMLQAHATIKARGKQRSIQQIALDTGLLTPADVDAIHQAQAASQVIRLDSLYADIAAGLGLATRLELERAFELQRKQDYSARIGKLLISSEALTQAQHHQILQQLLRSISADERAYMEQIRNKRPITAPSPSSSVATRPVVRPPSESSAPSSRAAGSFLASNIAAIRSGSDQDKRSGPIARLLESAMEAADSQPFPSGESSDFEAVAGQLRQVELALGKTPSTAGSSASKTSMEFSTRLYIQQRKSSKRSGLARVILPTICLAIAAAACGYLAYTNHQLLAQAKQALEEGEVSQASALASAVNPWWVSDSRLGRLQLQIEEQGMRKQIEQLRSAGQIGQALLLAKKLSERYPHSARLHTELEATIALQRALVLEEDGDLKAAVASYQAMKDHPQAQARLRAITEDLAQKVALARARLAAEPENAQTQQHLRTSLETQASICGDPEGTLRRQLDRTDYDKLLARAAAAIEQRRFDQALGYYAQAEELATRLADNTLVDKLQQLVRATNKLSNFEHYHALGQEHESNNRFEQAARSYTAALGWAAEASPQETAARAAISRCQQRATAHNRDVEELRLQQVILEALRTSAAVRAQAAVEQLAQLAPGHERLELLRTFSRQATDMVYVPAGPFTAGARGIDSAPAHQLTLPAFFIDRFEVRNRHYLVMVQEAKAPAPQHWQTPTEPGAARFRPEQADHPVVFVRWAQAQAYAKWAGKRLPTELEWEKAARGADGRTFPWGEERNAHHANIATSPAGVAIATKPVGTSTKDLSPFGCFDMAGNVSEWTASAFVPYPWAKTNAVGFDKGLRVLRGGSWRYGLSYAVLANRDRAEPGKEFGELGFRCALDIPDELPELK